MDPIGYSSQKTTSCVSSKYTNICSWNVTKCTKAQRVRMNCKLRAVDWIFQPCLSSVLDTLLLRLCSKIMFLLCTVLWFNLADKNAEHCFCFNELKGIAKNIFHFKVFQNLKRLQAFFYFPLWMFVRQISCEETQCKVATRVLGVFNVTWFVWNKLCLMTDKKVKEKVWQLKDFNVSHPEQTKTDWKSPQEETSILNPFTVADGAQVEKIKTITQG